jgi:hypothetical protein
MNSHCIQKLIWNEQISQKLQDTELTKEETQAGSVTQAAKCLTSKHETPNSNPSTAKQEKNKQTNLCPYLLKKLNSLSKSLCNNGDNCETSFLYHSSNFIRLSLLSFHYIKNDFC